MIHDTKICFIIRVKHLGVVHILRNQPRGGFFQMLTIDYGGGGLAVDYVINFTSRIIPI